jgi:hypothetical protein
MPDEFDNNGNLAPQTTPGAIQTPAPPPANNFSLPSLLAAIGGLAGNTAGIFTHAGDVGQGAISLSQQLQRQQNEYTQQNYQRAVFQAKKQQERNIGGALSNRLGEIRNPDAAKEIQTAADNDNLPEAQRVFDKEITEQRWEDRDARYTQRQDKNDDRTLGQGLVDFSRQSAANATQLSKQTPQSVSQAMRDQDFFASQPKVFTDVKSFQAAYNQRKDIKTKLSNQDAATLFDHYNQIVAQAQGGAAGWARGALGMDFGTPPQPSAIFKDYAKNSVAPEELQQFADMQTQISQHQQNAQAARTLHQQLLNPKTRDAARQQAMDFLGGGQAPQPPGRSGSSEPQALQNPGIPDAEWQTLGQQPGLQQHFIQNFKSKRK